MEKIEGNRIHRDGWFIERVLETLCADMHVSKVYKFIDFYFLFFPSANAGKSDRKKFDFRLPKKFCHWREKIMSRKLDGRTSNKIKVRVNFTVQAMRNIVKVCKTRNVICLGPSSGLWCVRGLVIRVVERKHGVDDKCNIFSKRKVIFLQPNNDLRWVGVEKVTECVCLLCQIYIFYCLDHCQLSINREFVVVSSAV